MSNPNANVRKFDGAVNAAAYWIYDHLLRAGDIVNDSTVTGTTVKAALNTLSAASSAVFPFVAAGLAEQDLVSYDASAATWRNRTKVAALKGTGTGSLVVGTGSFAAGTSDIILGPSAGTATNTGSDNIGIGTDTLDGATVALQNVIAIGGSALSDALTAAANGTVAIGAAAGLVLTSGAQNTFVGFQSGGAVTTGSRTTLFGYSTTSAAAVDDNTFIGNAVGSTSVGSRNTAVGSVAFNSASAAVTDCVALGYNALTGVISSTGPSGSVAIGSTALQAITTGVNTAVGFANQLAITTGTGNVTLGYRVMSNASVAVAVSGIVGIGNCLSGALTVGANNAVAVGTGALNSLTSGSQNCAVGYNTLSSVTSSIANAAFGYSCLPNCTGASNTGIGALAGLSNTSGASNVFIGASSGTSTTTGAFNVIIGALSSAGAAARSGCVVIGAGASAAADDTLVIRLGNTSAKEIVVTPVVSGIVHTGPITYLPITIGGTAYSILLQAP